MQQNLNIQTEHQSGDRVIGLIDLIKLVSGGWKTLLLFSVVGTLLGAAYIFAVKPVYEASAGLVGVRLEKAASESLYDLAERLQRPAFYNDAILNSCGYADSGAAGAQDFAGTRVTANVQRNSGILLIKVKADSSDSAKTCLSAVVNAALAAENSAVKPTEDRLRSQVELLEKHLSSARAQGKSAIESMSRQLSLQKQLLDAQLATRSKYFESLAIELQANEKSLKNLMSMYTATVGQNPTQTANQQFSASVLLMSTQQTLDLRIEQLTMRTDDIKILIRRDSAPNDIEIQSIKYRISDLESKIASGEFDKSLEADIQRLEVDTNTVRQQLASLPVLKAQVTLPIFASARPVSPRKALVLGVMFLVGALAGFAYLFGRRFVYVP